MKSFRDALSALLKNKEKQLDRYANLSLFTFNAGSIALLGAGYPVLGAISGLLSEPGFAWMSWKAKSWALWVLTGWWTVWWMWILAKNI